MAAAFVTSGQNRKSQVEHLAHSVKLDLDASRTLLVEEWLPLYRHASESIST